MQKRVHLSELDFLFALVRASGLCLRGSRVKCRSGLGFDDGASLPTIMQ